MSYDFNLKKEWDTYSALTTAEGTCEARGKATGEAKGRKETQDHVIKYMIVKLGLSDEQIATVTEAAIEYVRKIRASELLPLPEKELLLNPNLHPQNMGY